MGLRTLPQLQIPEILHHLSTERVITMEFVRGAAVCDREALQRMGVKPSDVAKLVSETFNEMIFTFGDVSAPLRSCEHFSGVWLPGWETCYVCWQAREILALHVHLGC